MMMNRQKSNLSTQKVALVVLLGVALSNIASCSSVLDEYAAARLTCVNVTSESKNEKTLESKEDNANLFMLASADSDIGLKTITNAVEKDFSVQPTNAESGKSMSFWHDIPLFPNSTEATANGANEMADIPDGPLIVNFVSEIPRGTIGKMEIMTKKEGNPVMFDTKDVKDASGNVLYERPRYIAYGPHPTNYGAIPQTWENSIDPDPITSIIGDNDPIDAMDIGSAVPPIGLAYQVKVLGALGLIDDNETDWKVMVINMKDPDAEKYNSVEDVPDNIKEKIFTFYRDNPTAVGDPQSIFYPKMTPEYTSDVWTDLNETSEIIQHTSDQYQMLINNCSMIEELGFAYEGC